jgi:hypothetical protein
VDDEKSCSLINPGRRGAACCGVMAQAQQQTKQPRIGFLFIGSKDQPHMEKFR